MDKGKRLLNELGLMFKIIGGIILSKTGFTKYSRAPAHYFSWLLVHF